MQKFPQLANTCKVELRKVERFLGGGGGGYKFLTFGRKRKEP